MQKSYDTLEGFKKILVSLFMVLSFEVLLFSQSLIFDVLDYFGINRDLSTSLVLSLIVMIISYLILFEVFKKYLMNYTPIKREVKKKALFYLSLFLLAYCLSYMTYLFFEYFDMIPISDAEEYFAEIVENHLWYGVVSALIIAPIFEELFFRRYLLNYLLISIRPELAIFISSLLFGAFHMNIRQFLLATVLGMVLGIVYNKTKDIKHSIFLHFAYNVMSFLPIYNGVIFGISALILVFVMVRSLHYVR